VEAVNDLPVWPNDDVDDFFADVTPAILADPSFFDAILAGDRNLREFEHLGEQVSRDLSALPPALPREHLLQWPAAAAAIVVCDEGNCHRGPCLIMSVSGKVVKSALGQAILWLYALVFAAFWCGQRLSRRLRKGRRRLDASSSAAGAARRPPSALADVSLGRHGFIKIGVRPFHLRKVFR